MEASYRRALEERLPTIAPKQEQLAALAYGKAIRELPSSPPRSVELADLYGIEKYNRFWSFMAQVGEALSSEWSIVVDATGSHHLKESITAYLKASNQPGQQAETKIRIIKAPEVAFDPAQKITTETFAQSARNFVTEVEQSDPSRYYSLSKLECKATDDVKPLPELIPSGTADVQSRMKETMVSRNASNARNYLFSNFDITMVFDPADKKQAQVCLADTATSEVYMADTKFAQINGLVAQGSLTIGGPARTAQPLFDTIKKAVDSAKEKLQRLPVSSSTAGTTKISSIIGKRLSRLKEKLKTSIKNRVKSVLTCIQIAASAASTNTTSQLAIRFPYKDTPEHMLCKRVGDASQAILSLLTDNSILVTHDRMLLGIAMSYRVPVIVFDNHSESSLGGAGGIPGLSYSLFYREDIATPEALCKGEIRSIRSLLLSTGGTSNKQAKLIEVARRLNKAYNDECKKLVESINAVKNDVDNEPVRMIDANKKWAILLFSYYFSQAAIMKLGQLEQYLPDWRLETTLPDDEKTAITRLTQESSGGVTLTEDGQAFLKKLENVLGDEAAKPDDEKDMSALLGKLSEIRRALDRYKAQIEAIADCEQVSANYNSMSVAVDADAIGEFTKANKDTNLWSRWLGYTRAKRHLEIGYPDASDSAAKGKIYKLFNGWKLDVASEGAADRERARAAPEDDATEGKWTCAIMNWINVNYQGEDRGMNMKRLIFGGQPNVYRSPSPLFLKGGRRSKARAGGFLAIIKFIRAFNDIRNQGVAEAVKSSRDLLDALQERSEGNAKYAALGEDIENRPSEVPITLSRLGYARLYPF